MKLKYFATFFILVLLFSCVQDDDFFTDRNTNRPDREEPQTTSGLQDSFGEEISARFFGRVMNENREPIEGAQIRVGDVSTTTDINGVFSVPQATVFEKFAYIKASKTGFVDGSRALVPTSGVNQVEIILLSAEVTQTINSGEVTMVSLPNEASVEFSGDFIDENGNNYNGAIDVIFHHLGTDDDDMDDKMPGMLLAEDSQGESRGLVTYGMLSVELRDDNGNELQLAENTTAQLSFPVSENIQNPPTTIPLWYFDEDAGYWIEEGTATLQNGMYVGDVKHFSFWNCDIPVDAITLCVTLQYPEQSISPAANIRVNITSENLNTTRSGITNSQGIVCGLVPGNEILTLSIPDIYNCGSLFETEIGPFSDDADITVTLTNSTNESLNTTIIGEFANCEGSNIEDGYIELVYQDETTFIPVTSGEFQQNITYCSDSEDFVFRVINSNDMSATAYIEGTFNDPETNLGDLLTCEDIIDYEQGNLGVLLNGVPIDVNVNGSYLINPFNYVTYTYTITNTGGDALQNIQISDDQNAFESLVFEGGDSNGDNMLQNDETWIYTSNATINNDQMMVNQASVSAMDIFGQTVGDLSHPTDVNDSEATITEIPNYTISYSAEVNDTNNNGVGDIGETVSIRYNINNTSNTSFNNVSIISSDLGLNYDGTFEGDSNNNSVFEASEFWQFTYEHTITNSEANDQFISFAYRVSSVDIYDYNFFILRNGFIELNLVRPELTLEKTASPIVDTNGNGIVDAGDYITYTFSVENTGNVLINGVEIDDTTIGVTGLAVTPYNLAVGATGTATADYILTATDIANGSISNQAIATGTPESLNGEDLPPLSDDSDDPTTPEQNDPTVTPIGQNGIITGFIFNDTNGNGIQDPGEDGIPGVEIVITDVNANGQTITTGADGNWLTNLPAGDAMVDIDETTLPQNFTQTSGQDPETVTVVAGQTTDGGSDGYN